MIKNSSDQTSSTAVVATDAGSVAVRSGWLVLAVLSLLMGFGSISTDLYLPAMPDIAGALHAGNGLIELTVSGYLVGFSLGQLVWGPIGDHYGRRMPVAAGLVLFIIGSVGCALAGSVWTMIGWRVVQAVGACAGVVLARAMVRDLYHGERAAQMFSTLMAVMAIAPLLGPLIGGEVFALAGWRPIFWLLVVVGVVTLGLLFTLPETLPVERRNTRPLSNSFRSYLGLLGERRILGYAITGGFYYAGMFAYVAGTPAAYIDYHGVPPRLYGLLFGSGIVLIMSSNMANSRLVSRFGGTRLLRIGVGIAALSGFAAMFNARGSLLGLAVPLILFMGVAGLIVANSIAGALADFPKQAGVVSGLVGAIHYGSGIAGSALVGIFADGTPWPLAWVVGLSGAGAAACAWLLLPTPRRSLVKNDCEGTLGSDDVMR